jgi:hypothetical protein
METNGHGTNVSVWSGRGLLHRRLNKRLLACIGANVLDGSAKIDWSVAQMAAALKVCRVYIDLAGSFSPAKRQAIIDGYDTTSFVALLKAPQPPLLALQQSINDKGDDIEIFALVHKYGIGRVIDACVAVEAAQ